MDGPEVAVVGGGPAGLAAAEAAAAGGLRTTVYDRMPSLGRKFLMAGRGGLNLTHGEPLDRFLDRYGSARRRLEPHVRAFGPEALRAWAHGLGQETFEGSSGRVFPRALKASPLLRAWLARLAGLGVDVRLRRRWAGWDAYGALRFAREDGAAEETARPHAVVLALGGASWPRLGSDGGWAPLLAARGVELAPFRPANVGWEAAWSPLFRERFAGAPLKGCAFTHAGRTVRGEAVVTGYGLEGGAVYALGAALRDAAAAEGRAVLRVDLKPDVAEAALARRLAAAPRGASLANRLRAAAHLPPVAAALLREAPGLPDAAADPARLAARIKALPLELTGPRPLERAISTAGGVAWASVGDDLRLHGAPAAWIAGEMLDWEAPTGGHLLTACFATGRAAGLAAARAAAGG